jgi:hypothetical protein
MDATVEWVKAVTAILGVAALPVLSWYLARAFERSKVEMTKTVQDNLDRDRREAGAELQLLKTWMGEELQRKLEADRLSTAREMDKVKSELARVVRATGEEGKRAEVASETLITILEYLDALRKTEWEYPKPDERDRGARNEFRNEVLRRWEEVSGYEPALRRALVQACVHLPDEAEDLIRKVSRLKMRMSFKVQPADSTGMLLDVPWPRLGDEIRPLEEEARQLLRPIARFEA